MSSKKQRTTKATESQTNETEIQLIEPGPAAIETPEPTAKIEPPIEPAKPYSAASVDELFTLKKQFEDKREEVVRSLKAELASIKQKLLDLGEDDEEIVPVSPSRVQPFRKQTGRPRKKAASGERVCPVCPAEINAILPHDGRKHKFHRKAFTAAELRAQA
jgi:hypothetical protein